MLVATPLTPVARTTTGSVGRLWRKVESSRGRLPRPTSLTAWMWSAEISGTTMK